MHAIFMLYGKKEKVERLVRDMSAQKHFLAATHPKDPKAKGIYIEGQVRLLPFGVYEYVFPKEDRDLVLTTLNFHQKEGDRYQLGIRLFATRKMFKAEKIPKFNTDKKLLWLTENVEIIPIGVRYDLDNYTDENGWTHEAI